MFSSRDMLLVRCSDAADGPLVISEDLMRCMVLYNIREYPSVQRELAFLQKRYGSRLTDLIKRKQFVVSEYMDIVWAYSEISDSWARQRYFTEKAGYLKSLRDSLEMLRLYDRYDELEPFELLDNAFDVYATLKDAGDTSPIAWVKNTPVTALHRKLQSDATDALRRLPSAFGCMGYNFTKKPGGICMQDSCGLSLYRTAEFDFSLDGIILTADNIPLFNHRKLEQNKVVPMEKKGDADALKAAVARTAESTPAAKKLEFDPGEMIYNLFLKTQREVINPLVGERAVMKKMMNMLTK